MRMVVVKSTRHKSKIMPKRVGLVLTTLNIQACRLFVHIGNFETATNRQLHTFFVDNTPPTANHIMASNDDFYDRFLPATYKTLRCALNLSLKHYIMCDNVKKTLNCPNLFDALYHVDASNADNASQLLKDCIQALTRDDVPDHNFIKRIRVMESSQHDEYICCLVVGPVTKNINQDFLNRMNAMTTKREFPTWVMRLFKPVHKKEKVPLAETRDEAKKRKKEEQDEKRVKAVKRAAKRDVKDGCQATMNHFFFKVGNETRTCLRKPGLSTL